jgi:hypothetical protein
MIEIIASVMTQDGALTLSATWIISVSQIIAIHKQETKSLIYMQSGLVFYIDNTELKKLNLKTDSIIQPV